MWATLAPDLLPRLGEMRRTRRRNRPRCHCGRNGYLLLVAVPMMKWADADGWAGS